VALLKTRRLMIIMIILEKIKKVEKLILTLSLSSRQKEM